MGYPSFENFQTLVPVGTEMLNLQERYGNAQESICGSGPKFFVVKVSVVNPRERTPTEFNLHQDEAVPVLLASEPAYFRQAGAYRTPPGATDRQGDSRALYPHLSADAAAGGTTGRLRAEKACPPAQPLVQSVGAVAVHWPRILRPSHKKGQSFVFKSLQKL
jgi:hypothetical protein